MDGTLVDTEECHWLAWRHTMAEEGHPLTYEQFLASFGQRNDVVLRGFFGPHLPEGEIDRIAAAKEAHYRHLVRSRGVTLLPGAAEWLDRLARLEWRQAIASSAPRANVDTVLSVLGIADRFGAVVAGEDVRHGKPDPEVFLRAAERLAVPPQRCVVVEDAPPGLAAAARAGMRAIGVTSSRAALHADIVVARLDQLPEDAFERLLCPPP